MLKVAVAVFVLVAVCYAQPPPAPTPPEIPETFISMVKVNFNSKADKTCGISTMHGLINTFNADHGSQERPQGRTYGHRYIFNV